MVNKNIFFFVLDVFHTMQIEVAEMTRPRSTLQMLTVLCQTLHCLHYNNHCTIHSYIVCTLLHCTQHIYAPISLLLVEDDPNYMPG